MFPKKLIPFFLRALILFLSLGVLLARADSNLCDWLLQKKIPLDQEIETLRVLDQGCSYTCATHAWHVAAESAAKTPLEIAFTIRNMMRSRAILAYRANSTVASVLADPDEAYAVTKAYGAVPESVWTPKVKVNQMSDADLVNGINAVLSKRYASEPLAVQAIDLFLNSFFGDIPQSFEFEGKIYNPLGFAKEKIPYLADNAGIKEIRVQFGNLAFPKAPYAQYSSVESAQAAETVAKTWLDAKKPVMFVYEFAPNLHDGSDGILNDQFDRAMSKSNIAHGVIITGYLLDLDGRVLAWKLQNSWGKKVGLAGVYFVSPEFFRRYVRRVQVVAHFNPM